MNNFSCNKEGSEEIYLIANLFYSNTKLLSNRRRNDASIADCTKFLETVASDLVLSVIDGIGI